MTTATDWDVTDTDTGSHPIVTDVTSAATDGDMVDVHQMSETLARVQRRADMLAAENAELRKQLGGYVPRRDPNSITGATDLTERQRMAALAAPTTELDATDKDGMPLHAIGNSGTWPTWLGDVHHADATWERSVGNLRLWADTYAARPVERTVVQPVEEDTSWRVSKAALYARMVVEAAEQHVDSVYSELAPDRIHADVPPDDRVDRMVEDPERYFAEARERAERQVQAESGADLEQGPPHRLPPPPPPPAETAHRAGVLAPLAQQPTPEQRGWLRRMWHAIRTWDGSGA